MSKSQELFGLLKGLQIVVRASLRTNEEYARHVWANSSVREILEENLKGGKAKEVLSNPGKQVEEAFGLVRETLERSSVVVEGIRHLTTSQGNRSFNVRNDIPATTDTKDLGNLDINSITLKELESLLAEHNKNRSFTLKNKKAVVKHVEVEEEKEHPLQEFGIKNQVPKLKPKKESLDRDTQYLSQWMNFLKTHDGQSTKNDTVEAKSNLSQAKNISPQIENVSSSDQTSVKIPSLSSVSKQRKVPSSRIGRMATFGGLFAGLGVGTVSELTKGALGLGGSKNMKEAIFSPNNAERIVDTLCKVRGAALKLGQILSIQDSNIVSPQLAKAFERVRQSADYMPDWQVEKVMVGEFGSDWKQKFKSFDDKPFAAASIGQVHRGVTFEGTEIAVKIQYPGVAKSIESDIDNLVGLLKVWDVFPPGMFIDNVVKVAKRELIWECDYNREADYTEKFRELIAPYPEYRVPRINREFTTSSVLATELLPGVPLDQCFEMSYEHRHNVGDLVMKLCLRELFEFRCMQTDPNWSNFLYDQKTKKLMLIDFGSTRFYTREFMDDYLKVIISAVENKPEDVLEMSKKMNFLTGYETKAMEEAHVTAVMVLGEIFRHRGEFDFESQNTTQQIAQLVPTMIAHRLCPPPEEIYSLHRKLSGVFLLCSRLKIKLACRPLFDEIVRNYDFLEN